MSGYETRRLQDVEAVRFWRPVRRELGVHAFGVNAWTGDDGAELIVAHDESSSGHEELYFVVEGSATFSVADETFTAPAGTLVFVRDPQVRRGAVAAAPGTTIFTVGAKPGEPYTPPVWEVNAETFPSFDAGEYGRAKEVLERALAEHGEIAGLLYNLACAKSRLRDIDGALDHLLRAVELDAQYADFAQEDEDFALIRDNKRFPRPSARATLSIRPERLD